MSLGPQRGVTGEASNKDQAGFILRQLLANLTQLETQVAAKQGRLTACDTECRAARQEGAHLDHRRRQLDEQLAKEELEEACVRLEIVKLRNVYEANTVDFEGVAELKLERTIWDAAEVDGDDQGKGAEEGGRQGDAPATGGSVGGCVLTADDPDTKRELRRLTEAHRRAAALRSRKADEVAKQHAYEALVERELTEMNDEVGAGEAALQVKAHALGEARAEEERLTDELDSLLAERAEAEIEDRRRAAKDTEECTCIHKANELLEREIDAKDIEYAALEGGNLELDRELFAIDTQLNAIEWENKEQEKRKAAIAAAESVRRSQVGWSHQSGVSRTTRRSIHESTQLGTYVDKQGSTRGSSIGETPGSTILEISQQQYGAGTQGGLLPTRQQQPPTPRPPTQQQYNGSGALWEKCAAAAGTASGTQRQHARATTPEIAQQVFVPYQQQQQRQQVENKEDEEELQQPHHKGVGAPEVTHGVWANRQQQHRQPDSSLIGPDPSPFLIPEHERSHKFPKKH
eukprot:CAMPEP_0181380496 /NCGR_PEP_ID=MMETSP1106-20121128/19581_1 /TAXON_ID=81844 /ORGANISM="Mantoniella antarctica, Strain SL-175" /LENGTH=517 /DNA_ID=CAMNT_0023499541 /DNA_START=92 /DNA_END=1645 /DNA_ORIENTATION=-